MSNTDIAFILLLGYVMALTIVVGVIAERLKRLREEVNVLRSDAAARKASVAALRAHQPVPRVDAKVRTTRRDSDDLPATGRMSQGVKRVRTTYDRPDNDDRLPDGPGSSAA